MNRSTRIVRGLLVLGLLGLPAPVAGQDTRAAIIASEQAEKAKRLHPYEPSRAERIVTSVTRGLTETPTGLYPALGSVYSGGGFALGAGYRRFFGDRAIWDARALLSVRAYKLVELAASSPGHAAGHVDVYARATWRDATQVAFYGLGPDSPEDSRATFGLREASMTGGARARTARWIVFGGALSYEDYTTSSAPVPSGAGGGVSYIHSTASTGIDWRPAAGYARRGGLYEIAYHNYADRTGAFDFDRVDAEIVQHIPILRENWVLSLRGRVQTTLADGVVPFFLLPSLGSGSTLRAYSSWRFRDRHSELFSAEWRWIPNRLGLDMALFYDVGKVASRRGDLDFDGLRTDVGIGARFHGPAATPLRIELARGSEGLRLVFAGGPAF
ncbi:MAG: hypothetical protein IT176_10400 [Acidobacteria bacterium]|nr:hypothetical protein [Acidobacteriota bacterium]